MKIGTYYYPEQWPRAQWERDFDLMAESGMQLTHFAEFAWAALEPSRGEFRFDWLDEAIDLAAARDMDVILCTPTAVVPYWLLSERPEILITHTGGRRIRPGGRRHYAPTSPAMLEESDRIVAKMAEHFGGRENVVGWQIDNELCGDHFDPSGDMYDQSGHTHEAFRNWLREKYGDLDALNAAWGNAFWRTERSDWSQILMPANNRPEMGNPHVTLDACRFWSRCWADFTRRQVDLLRPHIGDRFTTTNFMSFHPDLDPADVGEILDVTGIDVYPVTSNRGPYDDEADYRVADPAFLDAVYNHMAGTNGKGRWALLEVQPGQLNWSGVANRLAKGATRLMLWQAIAKGCEFITVYRWRQPRFGGETHHECLVKHDGVTLTDAGEDFKRVAAELREVASENNTTYAPLMTTPDVPVVGVAHSLEQQWWGLIVPQTAGWSQVDLTMRWHDAAGRLGLDTKIVHPGGDWQGCDVVVLPGVAMNAPDWPGRWRAYVEGGGHLVVTCRTAWQDLHGHMHEAKLAEPIHDLIGGEITAYDSLPEGNEAHVTMDDRRYGWRIWAEHVEPRQGTETWATYEDGLFAGAPAVTSVRHGKGRVTYVAVVDHAGRDSLAHATLARVAAEAGLPATPLPHRHRLYKRDGYTVELDATMNVTATITPPPR